MISLTSNAMSYLSKCTLQASNMRLQTFFNSDNLIKRSFSSKINKNVRGAFKLGLLGVTVGALVGTGYSLHYMNRPKGHIMQEQGFIPLVENVPKIKPSRQVRVLGDRSGLKLTLYQYQTCPFCCKVRAFLDYYGISYDIVEVDPVLRQDIKWSEYKKVPILVAEVENGFQPLNDSTMIISALATYLKDTNTNLHEIVGYYPIMNYLDENGSKKNEIMNKYFLMLAANERVENSKLKIVNNEMKWRKWTDEVLVHSLSPNVYRTREEAVESFRWFSDVGEWEKNFPAWERNLIIYVGAFAMWLIGKRLKKRHQLKDDVRESLYDECNYWIKAVNEKGGKYMGGDKPNLADLSVYGVLSSIEGCTAFKDLLEHTKISRWYFDMKRLVTNHEGIALL